MKFFTVFAAIVAVAFASPAEWTLHELSEAIQNPSTPAALKPVLEQALNELMLDILSGSPQTTTTVSTAVQDFSSWTLNELSEAIQDPATDPQLVIYLTYALNSMMSEIMSGGAPESVIVATPVGLLPVDAVIIPAPVESVVVPPTPVESVVTPAASSPLVQIIVNIKSQEQEAPVVIPAPVVLPEPVAPEVNPGDIIAVLPMPVLPEPVVLPQPVLPETIVNPIDVIAVTAPEVNPIDTLAPVPVVAPVGVVQVVGPIV